MIPLGGFKKILLISPFLKTVKQRLKTSIFNETSEIYTISGRAEKRDCPKKRGYYNWHNHFNKKSIQPVFSTLDVCFVLMF